MYKMNFLMNTFSNRRGRGNAAKKAAAAVANQAVRDK